MIWLDQGGRQNGVRLIPPPPALHGVVEHFWVQGPLPKGVWRVVPDLSGHLIFSLTSEASCRLVGARSQFCDIHPAGRILTIGARLRPGALPRVLRGAASQLTDRSVALDCVVGRDASRMAERMAEVPTAEAVVIFAEFLTARSGSKTASVPWQLIRHSMSVTELARNLGLSRRGVYDRLQTAIGLSPKLGLRIQRLHRALFAVNARVPLADAALRAGYSDQAHFTREATCLLGESPAAWRRRGCSILQDGSAA